ncbi:hypothetical protein [Kitasatospora sp. NPDC088134]|uniref:hypothetical protein n=1 Tax=Kitasatospora sp. NPDC088134 TaxID=3364071 RepID=UPI00380763FC
MRTRPTGTAEGPYDAAFLPSCRLVPAAAGRPVTAPVAKLGGQPVWLEEPAWPLEPASGRPLVFVGQFPVPGDTLRLAYLFLDEEDLVMGGAADPESGEAVLLVQPGGRVPSFAVVGPPGTRGRTLWRLGPDDTEIPVEWRLDLPPVPPDDEDPDGEDPDDRLGGTARYPHRCARVDAPWRFLFVLRDRPDGGEDDPYFLNFGYGRGWGFVSPDHREGRFYWERC